MTVLNPEKKTYQITHLSEIANASPGMQMVEFKPKVTVKPTGQTRTILGRPTRAYKMTAVIEVSLKKEMLERLKARNNGQLPPAATQLPRVTMEGTYWVTEKVNVSPGAFGSSLGVLRDLPGMQAVLDKLASIKGVPLESTQTIKTVGGFMGQQGQSRTVRTVATSLSDGTLPASLFTVPGGYTETRATPRIPGGAGRPRPGAPEN